MYDTVLSESRFQHCVYSIDISVYKRGILFPYLYIFTGIETGIDGFCQNTTVVFSMDWELMYTRGRFILMYGKTNTVL